MLDTFKEVMNTYEKLNPKDRENYKGLILLSYVLCVLVDESEKIEDKK